MRGLAKRDIGIYDIDKERSHKQAPSSFYISNVLRKGR